MDAQPNLGLNQTIPGVELDAKPNLGLSQTIPGVELDAKPNLGLSQTIPQVELDAKSYLGLNWTQATALLCSPVRIALLKKYTVRFFFQIGNGEI
jgi:hypothetical protein